MHQPWSISFPASLTRKVAGPKCPHGLAASFYRTLIWSLFIATPRPWIRVFLNETLFPIRSFIFNSAALVFYLLRSWKLDKNAPRKMRKIVSWVNGPRGVIFNGVSIYSSHRQLISSRNLQHLPYSDPPKHVHLGWLYVNFPLLQWIRLCSTRYAGNFSNHGSEKSREAFVAFV